MKFHDNDLITTINHYIIEEKENLEFYIRLNNKKNDRACEFEKINDILKNSNENETSHYEFLFRNDEAVDLLESMFFLEGLYKLKKLVVKQISH